MITIVVARIAAVVVVIVGWTLQTFVGVVPLLLLFCITVIVD
jgi:hypothetical protein